MSAREELKQTLASIAVLENQMGDLQDKIDPLLEKRNKLIWSVIVEEELFHGTKWSLTDACTLEFEIKDNETYRALFGNFYITNLSPFPGINTSISYEEFLFYFDDPKLMPPLIKKLGLVVDSSEITARLKKSRREVESLEVLCHTLGIKP